MTSQNKQYQTEESNETPNYEPYIKLWREVCRISWCDYLGLEGCALDIPAQQRRREAGAFLRSPEYAQLAEIIDYPQFEGFEQ